jgi:hypothetical protein
MGEITLTETQQKLAELYVSRGMSPRMAALAARGRTVRLTERVGDNARGLRPPVGVVLADGTRVALAEPESQAPEPGSLTLAESTRAKLVEAYVERGLPLAQARLAAAGRPL